MRVVMGEDGDSNETMIAQCRLGQSGLQSQLH